MSQLAPRCSIGTEVGAHACERRRIMDAGGEVLGGRVDGRLAVSRSLGDFLYKESKLPPAKQKVTAVPEISVRRRVPTEQVLVVACDGIWWVVIRPA